MQKGIHGEIKVTRTSKMSDEEHDSFWGSLAAEVILIAVGFCVFAVIAYFWSEPI